MPTRRSGSVELPILGEAARDGTGPGAPTPAGFALLALGFRPLYLLAAAFAAVSLPLWMAQLHGWIDAPATMPGVYWHMHEMLFGFAAAVIAGFLFTAARNWTGLPTPTGMPLAVICAVWLAARVLNWTGPAAGAMFADALFLLGVALPLASVLIRAGKRRNLFVVAIVLALFAANLLFHFALSARRTLDPGAPMIAAVFIVVLLECVMGGRVIPSFTASAIRGLTPRRIREVDIGSIALLGIGFAAFLVGLRGWSVAGLLFVAAALHAVRLAGWHPLATAGRPMLWILHVSYGWIIVGALLLGLAALEVVPQAAAIHALTIGSMAGLIIGMITRTALGHTGRRIDAGRVEVAAFALIQLAAITRVAPLLVGADVDRDWLAVSATLFSFAFLLYVAKYAPMLARGRIDGRPG